MNFTHANTDSPVWSRLAKDIILEGAGVSDVTITVSLDGSSVTSFQLSPVNGRITLPFRDLLDAILPRETGVDLSTSGSVTSLQHIVTLTASAEGQSNASLSLSCFRGGYDAGIGQAPSGHWLSWKPQETTTYPWAREFLSRIVGAGVSPGIVYAKLYYAYHATEVVQIAASYASSSSARVFVYDVSYSLLTGLGTHFSDDTLVAYDVYSSGILLHRFVMGDADRACRELIFQNSLGVPDTLFVYGDVERETDSSITSFTQAAAETELANDATEKFAVKTGSLQNRRSMDHVQDFLRSCERYVLQPGDIIRKIVVESIESEMKERELSSVGFTYHLAAAFSGRYYEDTQLDDYEYDSDAE